jgi:hypothetical protein
MPAVDGVSGAAHREEQKVLAGSWHDTSLGDVTFHDYVQTDWLPHKHLQASTRAAHVSDLNKHFHPFFGHRRLNRITMSPVQDWVTQAHTAGLSPRSILTYHVMLSAIFARAVKDQILVHNPATTPSFRRSSPAGPAPALPSSTSASSKPSRTGIGSWSRPSSRPDCVGANSSPSNPWCPQPRTEPTARPESGSWPGAASRPWA